MHWWCCSGRGPGIRRLVCVSVRMCLCMSVHDWVQHGGFCSSLWVEQSGLCAQHNETAVAAAFRQADWPSPAQHPASQQQQQRTEASCLSAEAQRATTEATRRQGNPGSPDCLLCSDWLAGWLTCWYESRTHTCRVRASDHIKLLIWSLAPELVEWDRNTAI